MNTTRTRPQTNVRRFNDDGSENKQIALSRTLLDELAPINPEFVYAAWVEFKAAWAANECGPKFLYERNDALIQAKRAATKVAEVVDLPQIPKGRYAITGQDGSTDFYRVTLDKAGKYLVFLYVSDKQKPVTNWSHIVRVLRQIDADGIEAASIRWGLEMVRCYRCGAQLTDEGNPFRHLGLGPDCGKK